MILLVSTVMSVEFRRILRSSYKIIRREQGECSSDNRVASVSFGSSRNGTESCCRFEDVKNNIDSEHKSLSQGGPAWEPYKPMLDREIYMQRKFFS